MRMIFMADHRMNLLICIFSIFIAQVYGREVSITIVDNVVSEGAVCLDGSAPAYHFDKGIGNGANNWLVFLSGASWCTSENDCLERINDTWFGLGSSKRMPINKTFDGILSPFQVINPYFYNWNRVFVRYCDGASFLSDVEQVNPKTNLHFRGGRIFKAIVEELLEKGMRNADNAIMAGNSAGGLATMLQCDNFRKLVPNVPRVKCVSDGGFFFHGKDLPGAHELREQFFGNVVDLHELSKFLPTPCTSKMDSHLCIFPENFIGDIQTPLFLVNAGFDAMQLDVWVERVPPTTEWRNCIIYGPKTCTPAQIKVVKDFQTAMIEAIPKSNPSSRGMFINSCFFHDHILLNDRWNGRPILNNKTITQAVGEWYFDQSSFQQIENFDFPYNCTEGHRN